MIAFSKCDMTDTAHQELLIDRFKSAFSEKQNCISLSANIFQELLGMDSRVKPEENKYRMFFGTNPDLTDSNYQETNYQFGADKIFDAEQLAQFFTIHPSIIRAKGFVRLKAGWNLFNLNGMRPRNKFGVTGT